MGVDPDVVASVAAKQRPQPAAPAPSVNAFVADGSGYAWLLDKRTSLAGVHAPSPEQLEALVNQYFPPAQTTPPGTDLGQLVPALRTDVDQGNLDDAQSRLNQLGDDDLKEVLRQLGASGPSLPGGVASYLELLYNQLVAHASAANARLVVAVATMTIRQYAPQLNADTLLMAEQIAMWIVELDPWSALEFLDWLGLDDLAAEGALALISATEVVDEGALVRRPRAAAAAGWTPPPNVPFGPWDKPKKMPYFFYIGNAAHVAIAEYYELVNRGPGRLIMTNVSPIASILEALEAIEDFKAGRVRQALARAKPDIFDFSVAHPSGAPGWVYEIKSARLATLAEYEALFYCAVLTMSGLWSSPGAMGAPGTTGVLPAPHGWFEFGTPAEGAIVYQLHRASKKQVEERGEVRETEELEIKIPQISPQVVEVTMTAAMLWYLVEYGWVLAL